jgi:hypothetical protein
MPVFPVVGPLVGGRFGLRFTRKTRAARRERA